MRRSIPIPRGSAAAFGLALIACGGDGPTPPPPAATAIALVSGDGQEGKAGDWLPEPFVVRVTDAAGEGVEGVDVTFSVTSGAGNFRFGSGELLLTVSRSTNADGMAGAKFWPMALGTSTVAAEVAGVEGSPVTFSTEVAVVVIRFGPLFECTDPPETRFFTGPDGSSDVTVPMGTPVEWLITKCTARVVSTSVPPGGELFDSGTLGPDERFEFVPDVAGRWEYEDQESGATATLTAQ